MATTKKNAASPPFDPKNLSKEHQDLLSLNFDALGKKYGYSKKSIIDRRYALRKKFDAAGVPYPGHASSRAASSKAAPKKDAAKKSSGKAPAPVKKNAPKPYSKKAASKTATTSSKEQYVELQLGGYLLKLNFFPKKVAVDPDSRVIEVLK